MKRTNIYITDKQLERLREQAEQEGVAIAEVIRRAIDAYLIWNDPTYCPAALTPNKQRRSHPPHQ